MTTVLYCGMADDIINPLMAVPDVDTIFAIDRFDAAFCTNGTLESQREDILTILREGHDKLSQHAVVGYPTTDLPDGPAVILEVTEERTRRDQPWRWEVRFEYGGKERKLVVFSQDFYQDWPEEVTDVDHLMSMGAPFEFWDHRDMVYMMLQRLSPHIRYYRQASIHHMEAGAYDSVVARARDMLGVVEGAGIEWMEKAIKTRHEIGWHEWYAKNSHRIVFDGE